MSSRMQDRQSAVLDAPADVVEKAPDMWHYLHHFDGQVAVAFCGFRKVPEELRVNPPAECVVCAQLRDGGSL